MKTDFKVLKTNADSNNFTFTNYRINSSGDILTVHRNLRKTMSLT